MCLDIDPDSVIHKYLNKKISNTIESGYEYFGSGEFDSYHYSPIIDESYGNKVNIGLVKDHNLTMLDSFHISLGAPDDETVLINKYNSDWDEYISFSDIVPIIGDITLAPILISKKDNKKSAWIPLNPHWFDQFAPPSIAKHLNDFDSFDHHCEIYPVQLLHVTIANLTGNPHDSIARPEDCIIDTITA